MIKRSGNVIPLSVIGGFLGSGKTTLVNRILQAGESARTVVLVNDFGAINVDERMIAAIGGQTIALTNGCVCCWIGDDLTDALMQATEMQPPPEWIVIEASGVADPRRIAQVGVIDPFLVLDGVIVMVDTAEILSYAGDHRLNDTILRQVRAADTLLLNKTDLVSRQHYGEVLDWLRHVVPAATIHGAVDADVPWELLRSPDVSSARDGFSGQADSAVDKQDSIAKRAVEHHNIFATWTFQTSCLLKKDELRAMLNDMPRHILRAKGLVRLDSDPNSEMIFQFAGQSRSLKPSRNSAPNVSNIVFIAATGDEDFTSIRAMLARAET